MLGAFLLTLYHNTCRLVSQSYSTVRFIDMLPAGTTCPECIYPDILHVQLDIYLIIHFGEHSHGCSRGMDTSLGIGCRHSLHAMHTTLILPFTINLLACELKYDHLESPLFST